MKADTVEANHRLGFEDDERDSELASILKERSIASTNNPKNFDEKNGVKVHERVPLVVGENSVIALPCHKARKWPPFMTKRPHHIYILSGPEWVAQPTPQYWQKRNDAAQKEGDGATPEGVHDIIGLLYRPDRIDKPTDWAVPIRPRHLVG